MKIVLFKRPYSWMPHVSAFLRRDDCSLAMNREAVTHPSLRVPAVRSRSSQWLRKGRGLIVPRTSGPMLISNILVDTVERLISQIAQTWRELQAQQIE